MIELKRADLTMVISDRLEAARAKLAGSGNARVYPVIVLTPTEMVALVVPKGSEHLLTQNPVGGEDRSPEKEQRFRPFGDGDWSHVSTPMLVLISADKNPMYQRFSSQLNRH